MLGDQIESDNNFLVKSIQNKSISFDEILLPWLKEYENFEKDLSNLIKEFDPGINSNELIDNLRWWREFFFFIIFSTIAMSSFAILIAPVALAAFPVLLAIIIISAFTLFLSLPISYISYENMNACLNRGMVNYEERIKDSYDETIKLFTSPDIHFFPHGNRNSHVPENGIGIVNLKYIQHSTDSGNRHELTFTIKIPPKIPSYLKDKPHKQSTDDPHYYHLIDVLDDCQHYSANFLQKKQLEPQDKARLCFLINERFFLHLTSENIRKVKVLAARTENGSTTYEVEIPFPPPFANTKFEIHEKGFLKDKKVGDTFSSLKPQEIHEFRYHIMQIFSRSLKPLPIQRKLDGWFDHHVPKSKFSLPFFKAGTQVTFFTALNPSLRRSAPVKSCTEIKPTHPPRNSRQGSA